MRWPRLALLPLGALLAPQLALAAGAQQQQTISLTAGPVASWCGIATSLAYSLLPLLLVVSLSVEAFGKPPSAPKDYGAVVWRLLVVLALLKGYPAIFGTVMSLAQDIAERVGNHGSSWDALVVASRKFLDARAAAQARELAQSGNNTEYLANLMAMTADGIGGALVNSAITVIFFLGQASTWILSRLGTVLALLLYVLGPLALAGAVPRGSDVGTRWLRTFVSILCWPLLSAMLVGLTAEYVLKGLNPQSSYEATYDVIGVAGLLSLASFAVPMVASSLIGGSMHALSAGWASAAGLAVAASGGVSAIGHVGSGVASGARAASAGLQAVRGGVNSAAASGTGRVQGGTP